MRKSQQMIQCPNCKKTFNYEKAEGYCPHCSTIVMNQPQQQWLWQQAPKPKKQAKPSPEMKKRSLVGRWIRKIPLPLWILLGIALVYMGTITGAGFYGRQKAIDSRAGYLEPQIWAEGEEITIDNAEIVITEIDWNPEPTVEVPEGYRLLRIHYVAAEDFSSKVTALLCVDGQYMISQLRQGMKVGKETIQNAYNKDPRAGEGNLGFMLPKDAESIQLVLTDGDIQERYILELEVE